MLLEEHGIWDFEETKVVEPTDSVEDHLISHIVGKTTCKEMLHALVTLY